VRLFGLVEEFIGTKTATGWFFGQYKPTLSNQKLLTSRIHCKFIRSGINVANKKVIIAKFSTLLLPHIYYSNGFGVEI
jgi:hypothetical protein